MPLQIKCGGQHSLALKSNGTVLAWGTNNTGQCDVPIGLTDVILIESSSKSFNTVVLKSDGTVVVWGENYYGICNVPVGLTGVIAIRENYYNCFATKGDGTVVVWGYNYYGQCNVPVGLTGVIAGGLGYYHCLALKSDGTVVAWGHNGYGQCNVPGGLTGVIAIAGWGYSSIALKSDGTVVAWGRNVYGQCDIPVGLTGVIAIAVDNNGNHCLALKSDGTVVAWGLNNYGQSDVPVGLTNVIAIKTVHKISIALKSDGTVVIWGENSYGQCNVPVDLTGVVSVDAGYFHCMALKSDDTVVAWGSNVSGRCNVPYYNLTYTEGTGGTITGTLSQKAYLFNFSGSEVTAVPNTEYAFSSWSDGVLSAARTDLNVTGDITVMANFTLITYTLTYIAGSGGTITGSTSQIINQGSNGTEVTAVPNTGYYFLSWSDGVLTAARTDLNVTGDITVTANFTLVIYKKIPMIRSEENNIDFSDKIYSPSFPVQHGVKYHSYITEKPLYTITTRTYGTTKNHWRSENVTKTDRDTLYDFWNTNISKGDTGVSVIDNRGRILFEANWDNWSETWEKKRGGVYNIDYNMESSVLWTPPCLGFFPMLTSPTVNYLQTGNIVLSNGVFCSYATDNRVLRKMGYALKVSDELSILQTGATVDLTPFNWSRESEYNNLTVFCQFKFSGHDAMHMSRIHLVSLEYGADCYFRLILEADDRVLGMLNNRGTIVRVRKSDLTYQTFDADIWYDAAFTFDAVTHKSYVYLCPSATTSFTDFLYGQTDITEQIGSYDGDTADPPDVKWDTLRLIEESTTAAIPPDGLVYLQNVMIFNGYLTAYDFNMLRRLCFLWNTNTTEMLPK